MVVSVQFARDREGRWVAEIPEFAGAVGFGPNKAEAKAAALSMAKEIAAAALTRLQKAARSERHRNPRLKRSRTRPNSAAKSSSGVSSR